MSRTIEQTTATEEMREQSIIADNMRIDRDVPIAMDDVR
jgi:hypothetical protein